MHLTIFTNKNIIFSRLYVVSNSDSDGAKIDIMRWYCVKF